MRRHAVVGLLTAVAALGLATAAPAADPPAASKKPAAPSGLAPDVRKTPAPPSPVPVPYPTVPGPLRPATQAPSVSGYAPARVVPGARVVVLGLSFGPPAKDRVVRVGGEGYGRELKALAWTSTRIEVALPADIRPGRYYIAVADRSGRWLSNLERTLEVVDPVRRLPIRLEVAIACSQDVIASAPTVTLRLAPGGAAGAPPLGLVLRGGGSRAVADGGVIYDYAGTLEIPIGRYRPQASDARFELDFWDYVNGNAVPTAGGGRYIERTNWEDCHARRRVTARGPRLPGPERQTSSTIRLEVETVTITAESAAITLRGRPSGGGGPGSLPAPTPVQLD